MAGVVTGGVVGLAALVGALACVLAGAGLAAEAAEAAGALAMVDGPG